MMKKKKKKVGYLSLDDKELCPLSETYTMSFHYWLQYYSYMNIHDENKLANDKSCDI